ncbi:MAG: HAD-IA family hydrolase [Pseudoruegeria sp.]
MKTVIFDLDGTLADTSKDLIASANACFRGLSFGDVLDPIADAATAFRGGRAMLNLGFSRVKPGFTEEDVSVQYPVLLEAYAENIDTHTYLYDGAIDAVKRLSANGYIVGICTNKPEGLAETLLQRLGIRDLFASMIGADTLPVRKPNPEPFVEAVRRAGGDPAKALLIGDTVTDRETSRAAGVPSILVTFGPTGDAVAELSPEGLLTHYDELDILVERLIG